MINQVILFGIVRKIDSDNAGNSFILETTQEYECYQIDVSEELITQLQIDDTVCIKGHLKSNCTKQEVSSRHKVTIIADKLKVLKLN